MTHDADLRLIFAGTPEFAAAHLRVLLTQPRYRVVGVYSQPDRPAGRGKKLAASPVKQLAMEHALPVYQPHSLRDAGAQAELASLRPDLMVVVAYGLILPQAVLDIPRLGCINVHASLLPRWRGAAPIQRAIEAGDMETGVSIMQMDAGLDTGPVLLERRILINDSETAGSLHDRLAQIGPPALLEALSGLVEESIRGEPQPAAGATYAAKIDKAETRIDWSRPAVEIARRIRALSPFSAAWSELDGQRIKLFDGCAVDGTADPGTILRADRSGLVIGCGSGAIRVGKLQLPGSRAVSIADLLNARAAQFAPGHRFQ